MGPGVHHVGGPAPGERRAVHMWARGTRAASRLHPFLARESRQGSRVAHLGTVSSDAANMYLKEELLWLLISTLNP